MVEGRKVFCIVHFLLKRPKQQSVTSIHLWLLNRAYYSSGIQKIPECNSGKLKEREMEEGRKEQEEGILKH